MSRTRPLTIADLCPYWTAPPTGGGPIRVNRMNGVVARRLNVQQFSARPTFGHQSGGRANWIGSRTRRLSDRYTEFQYFHPLLLGAGYALYRAGQHTDLWLSSLLRLLSPRYLEHALDGADIIQIEHPWLAKLAHARASGRPLVYVAHNVEAVLWQRANNHGLSRKLLDVYECEKHAVQQAAAVVAMSEADAQLLDERYGLSRSRVHIIPNGVDTTARQPVTAEQKKRLRARLGLDGRPVLLFTGSDHFPNKEALALIRQWQAALGPKLGVQFLVVGGVGQGVKSTGWMRVEGYVADVKDYLGAADIALNPLLSGSGTSLKIVEYLACGLPAITTGVGMRGLELVPERDVLCGPPEQFPALIEALVNDEALRLRLAENGRQAVVERYSWDTLGARMFDVYEQVMA